MCNNIFQLLVLNKLNDFLLLIWSYLPFCVRVISSFQRVFLSLLTPCSHHVSLTIGKVKVEPGERSYFLVFAFIACDVSHLSPWLDEHYHCHSAAFTILKGELRNVSVSIHSPIIDPPCYNMHLDA